jgi:hypothetical protein
VIGLNPIVGIALGAVPGTQKDLLEDGRVDRCLVGDDLGRAGPCSSARVKNRRVAARSRFGEANTSITYPNWSIARYRYTHRPAILR